MPVSIIVYYDYLCPWCCVLEVRLHRVKEEYGNNISVIWKSRPLMVGEVPGRQISDHSIKSRMRAGVEEGGLFNPWDENIPYPSSSMPAQIASKCALLQGEELFERFHTAVFQAFCRDCRDISQPGILFSLAADAGLDMKQFSADFENDERRQEVLADVEEVRNQYEGWGVPLTVVGGRMPIEGAAPTAVYRRAVEVCFKEQSG
ncbi:MAG: DsbA family protein [Dehalococcoidales bacterium]|nr:MAG: DsbA family protein [Dehalococcoidales bacterium]